MFALRLRVCVYTHTRLAFFRTNVNDVVIVVFLVPLPLLGIEHSQAQPAGLSALLLLPLLNDAIWLWPDLATDIRGGPFAPLPTLGFKQLLWDRPSSGLLLTHPRYEPG